MSVTAEIVGILMDAGKGGEEILLVAKAMERGPNAAMMFQLVDELRAVSATPQAMSAAMCGFAKAMLRLEERQRSERIAPSGSLARWGYEGPITPRLPERDWWPLRNYILERDKYTCHYCGDQPERMCADHVVPLSRGGTNEEDNLVACCLPCNSSKCDKLLDEWEGRVYA